MTVRLRNSWIGTILCLLASVGCGRTEPPSEVAIHSDADSNVGALIASFAGLNLEKQADVEHAIANASVAERAVIFVHVDWAVMQPQQRQFAEFMMEYQQKHPTDPLVFHYVDCTPVTNGYAPLRSLPGWHELQEAAGRSLLHGRGELIWMERGRVFSVEPILDFDSVSALVQKTEILMPVQDGE